MDPFERMYRDGPVPWDIGRPQPAVAQLCHGGQVAPRSRVIDVGCGTGDNAILLAQHGHVVVGVDASPTAIRHARARSCAAHVGVRFHVHDALDLAPLGQRFDVALDSGFFHTLSDGAHEAYRRSLAAALQPGATLFLLCMSDEEPAWGGPRRIGRVALEHAFGRPFHVDAIERSQIVSQRGLGYARAWLATITYLGVPVSTGN